MYEYCSCRYVYHIRSFKRQNSSNTSKRQMGTNNNMIYALAWKATISSYTKSSFVCNIPFYLIWKWDNIAKNVQKARQFLRILTIGLCTFILWSQRPFFTEMKSIIGSDNSLDIARRGGCLFQIKTWTSNCSGSTFSWPKIRHSTVLPNTPHPWNRYPRLSLKLWWRLKVPRIFQ